MRYQAPEMEVLQYELKDVILCSFGSNGTGNDSNTGEVKPPEHSWAP